MKLKFIPACMPQAAAKVLLPSFQKTRCPDNGATETANLRTLNQS
jgi:hypothetical protein